MASCTTEPTPALLPYIGARTPNTSPTSRRVAVLSPPAESSAPRGYRTVLAGNTEEAGAGLRPPLRMSQPSWRRVALPNSAPSATPPRPSTSITSGFAPTISGNREKRRHRRKFMTPERPRQPA